MRQNTYDDRAESKRRTIERRTARNLKSAGLVYIPAQRATDPDD